MTPRLSPRIVFAAALLALPGAAQTKPSTTDDQLWVGQFSQCSYNALGSVLTHFYGPISKLDDRKKFEDEQFVAAINAAGFGAYFGWAPWTCTMVDSGKMTWNGTPVTNLTSQRFALKTKADTQVMERLILVTYEKGERELLREKLRARLAIGPVIIWTPYASALESKAGRGERTFWPAWKHVTTVAKNPDGSETDAVQWGPFTHAVALFDKGNGKVLVVDGSTRPGNFETDLDTVVSTAAAMHGFVRIEDGNGSSILKRGLSGIENDEYNVVFITKRASATRPAARRRDTADLESAVEIDIGPMFVIWGGTGEDWKLHGDAVRSKAISAGTPAWHRLVDALNRVEGEQQRDMMFLIAYMPLADAKSLTAPQLISTVRSARAAIETAPWGKQIPRDIYLEYVLPYANLSEARDEWRGKIADTARDLTKTSKTPSEAALALNANLFKAIKVEYHPTKRPRPDQSATESITAGYASCSGLSVLLVNACRSVGVPARIVGTPSWFTGQGDANGNHGGNHTWVEIWDNGWHALGASEVSELDKTWFMDNASKQFTVRDKPVHRIYAARWSKGSADHWPMVWNPDDKTVMADDVTERYKK